MLAGANGLALLQEDWPREMATMAPRPPAARPNGQSGASMRKPAPPPTDGATRAERERAREAGLCHTQTPLCHALPLL